ncbi:MAG: ribosome-associated translation inhibitor RaiA [Bacillota bacterium]|nr:ribosome-associated translation inhibitor RaiA [Bacillota bacterium]
MQLTVKGKNLEVTPALRQYVEKRLAKLSKFFDDREVIAVVMLRLEREQQIVEVTLQVGSLLLRGEEGTADMYSSIDGVLEKLERQVHKYKTRINRKLRQENREANTARGSVNVPPEPEEVAEGAEEVPLRVVKTKRFAIKPMSVEEAIMQMDLLGHDFYVFSNAESEEVNVVYRRRDGTYGLIEPEF